jgi:hypothetical protein
MRYNKQRRLIVFDNRRKRQDKKCYMKKYNLKLVNELLEKKETRTALLENDLFLFSLYYFTEIFTHKASDFQKEICFELDNSKNLLII